VEGEPVSAADGRVTLAEGEAPVQGLPRTITNTGTSEVRLVQRVRGRPLQAPPAQDEGYRITRRWYDVDSGREISLSAAAAVPRGTSLLAVIEGESTRKAADQEVLVVDLLPAGFEIENGALGDAPSDLPTFVGPLTATEFAAARDDRYVAALRLDGQRPFRLAYQVRAVTPGAFAVPGVQVEDMYAPRFRANGAAARLVITADR
jgi:uncharacterized protein YfaS (alpha-2-macroglobulin family)